MDYSEIDLLKAIKSVKENDLVFMKGLIKKNNKILKMMKNGEKALIHQTAEEGSLEMLELLINHGCHINADDKNGNTALHLVITRKETNSSKFLMLKRLIELKADVNRKSKHDVTPLMVACCCGQMEIVKALLDAGADEKATDDHGASVLHWAAQGEADCLKFLLSRHYFNTILNSCDKFQNTPLFYALKLEKCNNAKVFLTNRKVVTNLLCYHRNDTLQACLAQLIKEVRGEDEEKEFLSVVNTHISPEADHSFLSSSYVSMGSSPYSPSAFSLKVETTENEAVGVGIEMMVGSGSGVSGGVALDVDNLPGMTSKSAELWLSGVECDPFQSEETIDFPMHTALSKEDSANLRTEFVEVSDLSEVCTEMKEEVTWLGD